MSTSDFFYGFFVFGFAAVVVALPTLLVFLWGLDNLGSASRSPATTTARPARAVAATVATAHGEPLNA